VPSNQTTLRVRRTSMGALVFSAALSSRASLGKPRRRVRAARARPTSRFSDGNTFRAWFKCAIETVSISANV
jgi:hypothetical protein